MKKYIFRWSSRNLNILVNADNKLAALNTAHLQYKTLFETEDFEILTIDDEVE